MLQWSHDLSAMDTRPKPDLRSDPKLRFNGAMTSQPWILPCLRACSISRTSFNGAMTSQPWILAEPHADIEPLCASMEP